MATAAIVISIISAVLSGGAVAYARRQTVANERLAEIEMARRHDEVAAIATAEEARRHARLRLYFEGSSTPKLIVRNDGPTAATDLTIEVVAAIGGDRPTMVLAGSTPVTLQPNDARRLLVARAMGDAPGVVCAVRWTDAAGRHDDRMRAVFPDS